MTKQIFPYFLTKRFDLLTDTDDGCHSLEFALLLHLPRQVPHYLHIKPDLKVLSHNRNDSYRYSLPDIPINLLMILYLLGLIIHHQCHLSLRRRRRRLPSCHHHRLTVNRVLCNSRSQLRLRLH